MSKMDGGPAFPQIETMPRDVGNNGEYVTIADTYSHGGASLRDVFAWQALTGVIRMCANDSLDDGETTERLFARKAYRIADAMLAERAKEQP